MGKAPCFVLVRTPTMGNHGSYVRLRWGTSKERSQGGRQQSLQSVARRSTGNTLLVGKVVLFLGGKAGKLNKIVIGSKGGKSNIMVVLFFTAVIVSSVYGKQGEKLFISYYITPKVLLQNQ